MRKPRFWRDLLLCIASSLVAAGALIALSPVPEVSLEAAVQAASRRLMGLDAAFRPADHFARVYHECGISPLTVDYSQRTGGPVVARVRVDSWGFVRAATFFRPEQAVESSRTGHLFHLSPDGALGEEIVRR